MDDDVDQVQGDAEVLSGKIQERYGRTKDEARKEVERFFDSIDRSRTSGLTSS